VHWRSSRCSDDENMRSYKLTRGGRGEARLLILQSKEIKLHEVRGRGARVTVDRASPCTAVVDTCIEGNIASSMRMELSEILVAYQKMSLTDAKGRI
jgi:hypothetical protein